MGVAAEATLTERLSAGVQGGLLMAGGVKVQDLQLTAPLTVLNNGSVLGRLVPGVTLPLGSVAPALGISPAATGSVDPTLSAQLTGGSAWVGSANISARVPLYDGLDGVRQGPSGMAELTGARRLDRGAVWVGASLVEQLPGSAALELTELAGIAGVLWNAGDRTAVAARVRVPAVSTGTEYPLAVGVEVRQVLGERPEPAH